MRAVWLAALVLMGLMPAWWGELGRTGRSDQLCGMDTRLVVLPPAPTSADPVRVIAAGTWTDSCVPAYTAHGVDGGVIRIDATVPSIGGCLTVITPWQFTVEAGSLAAGVYQVQLVLSGPFGEPARLCAKAEVEVRPAPVWRAYLPNMAKPATDLPAAGARSGRTAAAAEPGRES